VLNATLHRGPGVFETLAGEWDELAKRAMTNTPFQTLAYQRAWWRHLGPGELVTIALRGPADQLEGIGCFFLDDGALHFNGCVEETDYLDLICPAESAAAAWEVVLDCLLGSGLSFNRLELCNIRAGSQTLESLKVLAGGLGLSYEDRQCDVCPTIALPEEFEQYLASLDKQQRHELRRKLRRADGAEAAMEEITSPDALAQAVPDFLALLGSSDPEKAAWLSDARRALFQELADVALDGGMLQLLFLNVDGHRAAALFNFDYANRIWVYNSGLDPASYGHLSPGVVLTALAIEKAIKGGRSEFDFLRGDEEYKYRFGARDEPLYCVLMKR
jgi:CelD/BcsL family acetyltransferase involved in cellulose biosynthesis